MKMMVMFGYCIIYHSSREGKSLFMPDLKIVGLHIFAGFILSTLPKRRISLQFIGGDGMMDVGLWERM